MEERERLARQAGEATVEALKLRADGNRKVSEGHKLLGHTMEPGRFPTEQTASKHFEGHKLIAQGHEMLAQADEMFAKGETMQSELRIGMAEGFAFTMVDLAKAVREAVAAIRDGRTPTVTCSTCGKSVALTAPDTKVHCSVDCTRNA